MTPDTGAPAPKFLGSTAHPREAAVDLLFVAVYQDDDDLSDLGDLDEASGGEVGRARASGEFLGKPHTLFVTPLAGEPWAAGRVCLVGMGRRAECDVERLRRVAATCSYEARRRFATSVGFVVRAASDEIIAAQTAADGLSAAEFLTTTYRSDGDSVGAFPAKVLVVLPGADDEALTGAVRRGRIIGESANIARRLAHEPANVLTPKEFATRVAAVGRRVGLQVEVFDEEKIRELGLKLVQAVAQGSHEPPRLVVMQHTPPNAPVSPVLAFVGKGVTFDTGGISIKPASGMELMKYDMAGGAAVAGAMRAVALLNGPHKVIGIIPMVENMPGGGAIRPGDVVRSSGGTTVEVINTDAEGRLILADALWYAGYIGATHLVDVATLTGAVVVALGRNVSGVMGQPQSWVETLQAVAHQAGDRLWPLPIYEEAREELKSHIADVVNAAGRSGGAITAAAFLREFVGKRAWAHLDIAGTAWAEHSEPYQPKGPTGVAVRVLTELAMVGDRSKPKAGA